MNNLAEILKEMTQERADQEKRKWIVPLDQIKVPFNRDDNVGNRLNKNKKEFNGDNAYGGGYNANNFSKAINNTVYEINMKKNVDSFANKRMNEVKKYEPADDDYTLLHDSAIDEILEKYGDEDIKHIEAPISVAKIVKPMTEINKNATSANNANFNLNAINFNYNNKSNLNSNNFSNSTSNVKVENNNNFNNFSNNLSINKNLNNISNNYNSNYGNNYGNNFTNSNFNSNINNVNKNNNFNSGLVHSNNNSNNYSNNFNNFPNNRNNNENENSENFYDINNINTHNSNNTNTNNNLTNSCDIDGFEYSEEQLQAFAEMAEEYVDQFPNEDYRENYTNIDSNISNIKTNSDDKYSMGQGHFIEKFSANYKLADLKEWICPFQEWDEFVENVNQKVFGNKCFRPNQREIINASLSGRDIFVCMPTGGGKSLTFQIPALIRSGVTIVVMPLISLITDQVSIMNGLGVKVIFMNHEGSDEIDQNYMEFFHNHDEEDRCKLIFLTPEKLSQSTRTINLLKRLYREGLLERFVIDEAHCVSQWGREFRPDYLHLRVLKKDYPNTPILAITATAPNKIRDDIISQLKMQDTLFFRSSYNRNNLFIEIRNKKLITNVMENMANFIKEKYPNASGLIYCSSKKECETIAEKLKKNYGISAHFYHASMPDKQKSQVQEKWKNDEIRIIVATIAFGMGINKADVRFVIHHAMPKSFENYYQEVGRAGRDGKNSHCIMYYNPADRRTLEFLMFKSGNNKKMNTQNLRKMTELIEYCEEYIECRRVIALLYFDEKFNRNNCNKMCDNCKKMLDREEKDISQLCRTVLEFMNNCYRENLDITLTNAVDYLRGKKIKGKTPKNDNNSKALNNEKEDMIKKIFRRLIISRYIDETLTSAPNFKGKNENIFCVLNITNEGIDFLRKKNNPKIIVTIPKTESKNNYAVDTSNNNGFIDKNDSKDINDYNFNTHNDVVINNLTKSKVSVEKTNEVIAKKKDRKYNRARPESSDHKEDNKNNTNANTANTFTPGMIEEDYGFCTQTQFDELLEKLKLKRRELLKEENRKLENEINNTNIAQVKKLTVDDIFPITGLKELCRKLPTKECDLDSNYIFGVGNKFLQKYGKEFLPEIKRHMDIYQVFKDETEISEILATANKMTGKKGAKNTSYIKRNNNIIPLPKESTAKKSQERSESNPNNNSRDSLHASADNRAMFHSMSNDEIRIDCQNGVIASNSKENLNKFMEELQKLSEEKEKQEDAENELFYELSQKIENNEIDLNDLNPEIDDFNRDLEELNSFNNFDKEVLKHCKEFNAEKKVAKGTKKRKRSDRESDEEDESALVKKKSGKGEFFKKKAIWNKMNKAKAAKRNNFI